ncbi:PRC-barrel domain-containing protein [Deinococcus sp.]|uniref:PRC-barrel domain-containing protein n=1 Tax=Deinococcus sp. TaxID=47478 RepID=UPI003CC6A0E3
MLKGKELIGRKIVTLDGADQVDSVHDLIFDEQGNRVMALLIDEGGWFHAAKVLLYSSVRSVGEDAVMIDDISEVISANDDSTVSAAMHSKVGLIGLNLITSDGKELGRISDVFFDELSGQVVGYEATGGLFSDLSSGRTFVPAPESITIGAQAAIVPPALAQAMQEQEAGGLQGALGSVASSVKGAASNVAGSVREVAGNLGDATRERQKAFVVGKVAAQAVVSEAGVSVVRQGETITATQAEQAEALGLLGSLTAAAGGGAVQELYGQVKDSVQGSYENMATATRERQKEFVTGKVAGADVLTDSGVPIVGRGQVITALHAEAAEQAGVLGSLTVAAASAAVQGGLQGQGGAQSLSSAGDTIRIQPDPASQVVMQPASILGRRVQSDVLGPNRSFVAAQGQIVTQSLIERARSLGRENDLIAAVVGAGTQATAQTPTVGDTVSAASERLAAGAQNVKEGAASLLDRAKDWISDTRDRAQIDAENLQIERALGRPVNRVVLDPQDQIILNIGEIITHKAVEQARASEVLGILLSSVSTGTPVIDPLAVKPTETGQAALESQPPIPSDLNKPGH